jgi:CubicO group peptidase (beta-lactamase class C family)
MSFLLDRVRPQGGGLAACWSMLEWTGTRLRRGMTMTASPLDVYELQLGEFAAKVEALAAQGYRPLSISQYGDPGNPLVASVWDQRPGPALRWVIGASVADFVTAYQQNELERFYPVLITATGLGAATRMTGVFEERPAAEATELTVEQDTHAFGGSVVDRARDGWILRSATIYDDPPASSRVAAIWEKNTGNVAWIAFAGLTEADHQVRFDAQSSQWARLAFVTGSAGGRLLAIYRDDQLGLIGEGFVARYGLSLTAYEQERDHWHGQGLYQVCLQGYGTAGDRRFAAIFVVGERPVQRVLRVAGSPAVPTIDQAVIDLMKASNIRGASLAIAQGTRLVLARAYTWAEPDYPQVQPTTTFRIASCSKLVAALGIHQLVAEGALRLTAPLPEALPLSAPDGGPPVNPAYLDTAVHGLLEYCGRFERYENQGPAVAQAFGTPLPVTHAQIASYVTTMTPLPGPSDRLDDTGYFLAGQIIKRERGTATLMEALADHITGPLQITRLHTARSLLADQPKCEARHHPRDLVLVPSVMSPDRPLVPREYGDENLETMETSGGLSAAAPDLVRILAAMTAKPYTPLGRPAVDSLLSNAVGGGHGFDELHLIGGHYKGDKGGLLQTSQSGLFFTSDGFSYVILWNGQHTESNLTLETGDGPGWYPEFTAVLQAAQSHTWPAIDLFPTYGMPSLPVTEGGWRRCGKCQGLFSAPATCPAGGPHTAADHLTYLLMRDSAFTYGQSGWHRCRKCKTLSFGHDGSGSCAASGPHDPTGSPDYTLVIDSPYHEPQRDWRHCHNCQSLFYGGAGTSACPAGTTHIPIESPDYSIAPG